jgi:hypothetical protein
VSVQYGISGERPIKEKSRRDLECSSDLYRSNTMSIITDCPHREKRKGWDGMGCAPSVLS